MVFPQKLSIEAAFAAHGIAKSIRAAAGPYAIPALTLPVMKSRVMVQIPYIGGETVSDRIDTYRSSE
jgi:hypothetical protein